MNPSDTTASPPPQPPPPPTATKPRPPPVREDCWSEAATATLIDAWGERYLELNRGNLRQKHWQQVADAVNALHATNIKQRRTDVQCKNRIDTIKKKYKVEKLRVSCSSTPNQGTTTLVSDWPFFARLDALIGDTVFAATSKKRCPPFALPLPHRKIPPSLPQAAVASRPAKDKRPAGAVPAPIVDNANDSAFRRNRSVSADMAAAAAAAADSGSSRSSAESRRRDSDGFRQLARAIMKFGEIYERVEAAKQQQMIELEKQRMEFAKGLEFQRMQLFVDSQVQLEKIKRAKRANGDGYL